MKFNFHKFRFMQARRKLEPQFARSRELDEMESHLHHAVETKNQIVRANLRLVVSVARKHLRPGMNLMELISDGNLTLMCAVEGFDTHRGNRFSTYATLALMKGFARSVPLMRGTHSKGIGRMICTMRCSPTFRMSIPKRRWTNWPAAIRFGSCFRN